MGKWGRGAGGGGKKGEDKERPILGIWIFLMSLGNEEKI